MYSMRRRSVSTGCGRALGVTSGVEAIAGGGGAGFAGEGTSGVTREELGAGSHDPGAARAVARGDTDPDGVAVARPGAVEEDGAEVGAFET